MSNIVFVHDAATGSFNSASGAGITVDSDEATFDWDEMQTVTVDAPADLEGAFDTDEFIKIDGVTIARPIKQPYHVADSVEVYKKPAEELRKASWSFDNAPFTLDHPETGMVKDINDVHGFFRNARYYSDDDRLKADLYIPETDSAAREYVSEHQDVSVGFFNRLHRDYDGDTGDLDDDDVDGFQVDIYGNHVAAVDRGRCPGERGCGLNADDSNHGHVAVDATTSFLTEEDQTSEEDPEDAESVIERLERKQDTIEVAIDTTDQQPNASELALDQPSGIVEADGQWFAVGSDEHSKDSTDHPGDHMYPVGSCADVADAWRLRSHGEDLDIEQSTLEERIIRAAVAQDCTDVPDTLTERMDMETDSMSDEETFTIPDLSVDALAEKHDQVKELRDERDAYQSDMETLRDTLDLADDECVCDTVSDLKDSADRVEQLESTLDAVADGLGLDDEGDLADRVEEIGEEWRELREDKVVEKLDTLEELGADRDEWEDESVEAIEDEINRRKEVLDAVDDTSPTGIEESADEQPDADETTIDGRRRFGRGYAAQDE